VAVSQESLAQLASSFLGIHLSQTHLEAFEWYTSELLAWNKRFNLTAITDAQEVEIKHFLDSLTCLQVMGEISSSRVVDVGTGAGFPGLPLKIVCPSMRLTLVESIGKKTDFCQHVIDELGLEGVEVVHARSERVGHLVEHRQGYDWAVARAVAAMPVLVEYLLPLLKLNGQAVLQKGDTAPAEAHAAEEAIRILGGRMNQLIPLELPGVAERRYLVVIDKVAATPDKYPRRSGIPAKRPLR
jgi:16S rRNA (guanine527-N7)-methyltransferase